VSWGCSREVCSACASDAMWRRAGRRKEPGRRCWRCDDEAARRRPGVHIRELRLTPRSDAGGTEEGAHLSGFLGFLPAVAQSSSLTTVDVALAPFSHQRSAGAAGFLTATMTAGAAGAAAGADCASGRGVVGAGGVAGLYEEEASAVAELTAGAAEAATGAAADGDGSTGEAVSEAPAGVTRSAGTVFSTVRDESASPEPFGAVTAVLTAGSGLDVGDSPAVSSTAAAGAAEATSWSCSKLVGTEASSVGYV